MRMPGILVTHLYWVWRKLHGSIFFIKFTILKDIKGLPRFETWMLKFHITALTKKFQIHEKKYVLHTRVKD